MKQLTFNALSEANAIRGIEWTEGNEVDGLEDLLFRTTELGGEVGELQNFVKKYARHLNGWRGGMSYEEVKGPMADELADIVICVDRVAEAMGINLGEAVVDKFNKTSRKQSLGTYLEVDD